MLMDDGGCVVPSSRSQSIGPSRQRTACGNAPAHSKRLRLRKNTSLK